jgi:hypothetical protein
MKLVLRIANYGLLGLCIGAASGALVGYLTVRGERSPSIWLKDHQWRDFVVICNAIGIGIDGLLVGLALGVILVIVGITRARRPSPFA